MMQVDELTHTAAQLLEKAGFHTSIVSLTPCASGGNNRTYRLETTKGLFALKQYFRQETDKRDRLASEYAFLAYANRVAASMVPRLYSMDTASGLALYEFIQGEPLHAPITIEDVASAAAFFRALNQPELQEQASHLPIASEACFSIREHLKLIDSRIAGLQQMVPEHDVDKLAAEHIQALESRWGAVSAYIKQTARIERIDINQALAPEQRCISPSDFGFHNALRLADGRLCFLDFEYAGWDDSAKMVGDFFSQLAIPVPHDFFDAFTEAVMAPFPQSDTLIRRAQLLYSVCQIKWCCIALNIFIPSNLARRQFANPALDVINLKMAQLKKAETLLQAVEI